MPNLYQLVVPYGATNLLLNPNWEADPVVLSPWTYAGTGTVAPSTDTSVTFFGGQSLKITGYKYVYQTVTGLTPGLLYQFSIYANLVSGTGNIKGGNADFSAGVATVFAQTGTFTRYELTETCPANGQMVMILQADDASSIVYVSGAQIELLDTGNLVLNSYFVQWASTTACNSWTISGASIVRSSTAYYGPYSALVTGNGGSIQQFVGGLTSGKIVSITCTYQVTIGSLMLNAFDSATGNNSSTATLSAAAGWQTVTVKKTVVNGSVSFGVFCNDITSSGLIGFMSLAYANDASSNAATTYIDGEQTDCYWTNTTGNRFISTSTRPSTTRAGGKVVNLSKYGALVTDSEGQGLPPVVHIETDFPVLDFGLWSNSLYKPRNLKLDLTIRGASLQDLHAKKTNLNNALKIGATPTKQQAILRYLGSGTMPPKDLTCVYSNGLDGRKRGAVFVEKTQLELHAVDPRWKAVGNQNVVLWQSSLLTPGYILARVGGVWTTIAGGAAGGPTPHIIKIVTDDRGNFLVMGQFVTFGGVSCNGAALYNAITGTITALGATPGVSMTGGNQLVSDGVLYNNVAFIVGSFDHAGGGVANSVASYNIATGVWSSYGTGAVFSSLPATVTATTIDFQGRWWIGGSIDHINGVNVGGGNVGGYYDLAGGTGWHVYQMPNSVYTIKMAPNGQVYFGGNYSTFNGVTVNGLCTFDGTTVGVLGGSITACNVRQIAFGPDGVYIAGNGTLTINGTVYNSIARYSGAGYYPVGSGIPATSTTPTPAIYGMYFDSAGTLHVSGLFDAIVNYQGKQISCYGVAKWTGTEWRKDDADFPVGAIGYTFVASNVAGGVQMWGGDFTAAMQSMSYVTNVTMLGTADVWPSFVFHGPGVLESIQNGTTGARLDFGSYLMASGETLWLNLDPTALGNGLIGPNNGGQSFWSSSAGDLLYRIVGNMQDFVLSAGQTGYNQMFVHISGTTSGTTSARIRWKDAWLEMDGGA